MIGFIHWKIWFSIWTSACLTGETAGNNCSPGLMGPGCNYSDIAYLYHKTELISKHLDNTDPPQYAEKANDGLLNTCSMTAESDSSKASDREINPYWKVWFPTPERVSGVIIQTLDTKKGFFHRGFRLFVEFVEYSERENKTFIPKNSSLCYNSSSGTPINLIMEIFCDEPQTGNQIRLELADRNAQLVLCDMRVYRECPETRYGTACLRCSGNCKGSNPYHCHRVDGHCPEGCAVGWEGFVCDKDKFAGMPFPRTCNILIGSLLFLSAYYFHSCQQL